MIPFSKVETLLDMLPYRTLFRSQEEGQYTLESHTEQPAFRLISDGRTGGILERPVVPLRLPAHIITNVG